MTKDDLKKSDKIFGQPHVVINLSRIGIRYFRVGIKASQESVERLIQHFIRNPSIGWIFLAEGDYNIAIGIWARDNAEINDISHQIRNILYLGDEIIFQSELTSLYGFGNRPIKNSTQPMCIIDSVVDVVELSPLEIDYIKLLVLDSSTREDELANLLNIKTTSVRDINKNLTDKGVIVGYQDRINYDGIYYKVFIDTSSKKSKSAEDDLFNILWEDKKCIYIARANSKYDLEFEIILENENDITEYLQGFNNFKLSIFTKNIYTNLYPVNKVANLKEIKDVILKQSGEIIDLRNSKLWYLNYGAAEAYINIYEGNQKYFELMEKSELDLFEEISTYIKDHYKERLFSILDVGSGNGLKGKIFIEKLGTENIKAYYPIDIQPIELSAALNNHKEGKYAKHPTLLDIESISVRFPLKDTPNERQLYVFFGGTYGNFERER